MNSKRGRTYGKKKPVPNTTSAIFAKSNLPSPSAQDSPIIKADIFNEKSEEVALHDDDMPSKQSPVLKDLVEVFSALEIKTPGSDELRAETSIQPSNQPPTKHLLSLAETDSLPISIESWRSVLPENCTLAKIAEASYAEVYRITTSSATSIVKIMPLKLPDDAESERRTYASDIKDVIPELRIMNILTEIPGFVQFKGARIVTGKQAPQFVQAWEEWASTGEEEVTGWNSEFEHPGDYADGATFLAIELGDAGDVLEEVMVDSKEKFWDIFLGTVIALARAEAMHEFEHRDLHENNICVYSHNAPRRQVSPGEPLLGCSNLEVTIIDYGLSRALLPDGRTAFKDLETDLEIFRGKKWHRQFETYRQMRSHLYTGTIETLPLSWHKNDASSRWMAEAGKSWEDHTPLSNVFWISYLYYYLTNQYIKHGPGRKADNKRDIELVAMDLESRLDFMQTRRVDEEEDGRFFDAGECLNYCVHRGWITEAQLNGDMLCKDESLLQATVSSDDRASIPTIPVTEQAASADLNRYRTTTTPKTAKSTKLRITTSRRTPLTPSTNIKNLRPRPHSSSPRKQPSEPCPQAYPTSPSKISLATALKDDIGPPVKVSAARASTRTRKGSKAITAVIDNMPRTRSSRRQQEQLSDNCQPPEIAVNEVAEKACQIDEKKAPRGRRGRTTDK